MAAPSPSMSIADALAAVGHAGLTPPRRSVIWTRDATLLTLATLDADGRTTWHGLLLSRGSARAVGPPPPESLLAESSRLTGPTGALVDLLQAAYRSYADRLEELGVRVDALEVRDEAPSIADLGSLNRSLAAARKHVARIALLVTALEGPLGIDFPELADHLGPIQIEVAHLESLSTGLSQTVRDLLSLRNAVESNRLADAANELGRVSNRIAALANNSNVRMLGVAYLAFVIALVSVVVLIPNTAATILGMPSAAWVPGIWVDVILVLLAIVPLAVVFSRPWVLRLLRGVGGYEARSSEGISDLPEVPPPVAARPSEAEPLIRGPP
jgi:hypothetical protein